MKLARQLLRVFIRHEFWLELFLSVWPFILLTFTVSHVVDVVQGEYPWWAGVGIGCIYALSWTLVLRGYWDRRRITREHRRRRANHPGGASGGSRSLADSGSGARGGDGPGVVPDSGVPIVGFRAWSIIIYNGAVRLTSLTRHVAWPPGRRMEARCMNPHTGDRGTEALPGPAEGCSCGIYAGKHPEIMPAIVVGWVSLWGKVIEHEAGYRAQFAYPQKLILVDHFVTAKLDLPGRSFYLHREPEEIARALREGYGVPVDVMELGAVVRSAE